MADDISLGKVQKVLKHKDLMAIRVDFMTRIVTVAVAGLALITVLAWDRALEDLFMRFLGPLDTLEQKMLYAVLITILATLASVILGKYFIRTKKRSQEEK